MVRPQLGNVLAILAAFVFVELVTTGLYRIGLLEPSSVWMHERTDPDGQLRFDPIRGAWISDVPAKIACIATNGVIETIGTYRGNNAGFPDRDDFTARRGDDAAVRRFAVFGDSFTHAQFLAMNWPDRAEDLTRAQGRPLQLLNFSLDGAGLANWTSVLARYLEPEGYELDGIVFAVWGASLQFPFTWWDDRPRGPIDSAQAVHTGISPRWTLDAIPASFDEADTVPNESWLVVPSDALERALDGDWMPEIHRSDRLYLTDFLRKKWNGLVAWLSDSSLFAPPPARRAMPFQPGQRQLIARIGQIAKEMDVPVLVVRVPSRPEQTIWADDARRFAAMIGATYVDGDEAFAGLTESEDQALWLPYDGHWNQQGSDRFAAFMADVITDWSSRITR